MADKGKIISFSIGVFFVVAFVAELFFVYQLNPYPCEDAYITYRFSSSMAQGNGPVFIPGERVEGYSNFIWMAGIALADVLGFDMPTASRVAGGIFNALSLFLVWFIPWRYLGIKGLQGFIAPLLYMLFLPFHFYATSGLETSLYTMLLLICLLILFWAQNRPWQLAVSGFSFLMLSLTRPEGIIFFAFFCCYWLWRCIAGEEKMRQYLPAFCLFCVCYGAFILWRLSYYGLPFPNTYYAKGCLPLYIRASLGFFFIKGFFSHYLYLFICFFSFFRLVVTRKINHAIVTVCIFVVAGMMFSIGFSGFDWMPFFRYTVPIVPMLIILFQIVFTDMWDSFTSSRDKTRKIVLGVITSFVVFMAVEQFVQDVAFDLRYKGINDFAYHNQKIVGEWMKNELGSKPLVAVGDVGRLAFFSQATVLDIFGLTSRKFATLKKNYGSPDVDLQSLEINFASYKEKERKMLLEIAPDYVFVYNARLKISDTFYGSVAGIADHQDFLDQYKYMSTFYIIPRFSSRSWPKLKHSIDINDLSMGILSWIQNGWGYDIYIRKDSPYKKFAFEFYPDEKIKRVYEFADD